MSKIVILCVVFFAAACQGFNKDDFESKCVKIRQPGLRFFLQKILVCRNIKLTAEDMEDFKDNIFDISKEEIVVFEGGDLGVVNSDFFKQFPYTKEMIFQEVSMNLKSSDKLSLHAHMEILNIISSKITENLESNAFHGLPKLKSFVLTNCRLEYTTVDSHLLKMNQRLEELTLIDSRLHPPLDTVSSLKLVEEDALDNLVNLRKLYITVHNMSKPFTKFYKYKKLNEIVLQGYFEKFPEDLPETTEKLDIGYVKFDALTKDNLKGLKNLKNFAMYHCDLKNVDLNAFDDLENLEYLTLNNNFIEQFSYAHLKNCNKIKYLVLSGNPIKSDLDFSVLGLKEHEPLCFKKKFWGLF